MGFVLLALTVLGSTPAAAQFTCTVTPTDRICVNNGTDAVFPNITPQAGQNPNANATTTNNGTATFFQSVATIGGNATATNNGTVVAGFNANTPNGGNATATNTGTDNGAVGAFVANGTGNATATNSGFAAGGISASVVAGVGDATATNSGTNLNGISANVAGTGNATVTNSGTNSLFVTVTTTNGNATFTNTGSSTGAGAVTVNAQSVGNAVFSNSGTVGTDAFFEVLASQGNVTATNSGTLTGTLGIIIDSQTVGNAVFTNSGTVNTSGIVQVAATQGNATSTNSGIINGTLVTQALTGNATMTNSGAINGVVNVFTNAGNTTATNSGSIAGSLQLNTASGNSTATNSGSILGGINALALSGNVAVTNSGSVGGTIVINSVLGAASMVNSGTVTAPVVLTGATSETLTNSGTISNFGGTAIQFTGGPDTLDLFAGSTIVGAINLVGVNDTVNFFSGNHNLTFNTLAGATVNGPDPFVVVGNRAVAIDPTPFALADKTLMDFTRGISGILGTLGGAAPGPNGPVSSAFAPSDTVAAQVDNVFSEVAGPAALAYAGNAMVFKNPTAVDQFGRSVWARGFGGQRIEDADGPVLRSTTMFMGGAVGFDIVARPDLRLGVFAGGGQSELATALNVSRTDSDTVFGGLYGRWGFTSFGAPSFLDFALHGGGSRNTSSRTINNNTLAGGIEVATASYDSWYVSPEVAYGINVPVWSEYTLTPSLRVRYVAGTFGGYTETGTTAPLTVASRTIQDFEERGEVKLTRATPLGPDLLLTSVYVGALGIERAGDTTVNTVVLGAGLPFVTPGRNAVAGVVGGGGMEWRTREGWSLFGAAEAIGFTDQSTVVSARGGLRVAW